MKGPSQCAGIAAVFVFGVGLLIVGKTWAGIGVLGMGVFALAFTLSAASGKALLTATGALICSAALVYQAASNEITGQATYHHGIGRGSWSEPVTRQDSPSKFREATNVKWAFSIVCAVGSACGFMFYREIVDSENFF